MPLRDLGVPEVVFVVTSAATHFPDAFRQHGHNGMIGDAFAAGAVVVDIVARVHEQHHPSVKMEGV